MKATAVVIADSAETARAIDIYVRTAMSDAVETCYMTYRRPLLSGTLVRHADIFIVELFSMDSIGLRAEGILTAEKWLSFGKRALIVSGSARADTFTNPLFWDLAAKDQLRDRILSVLAVPAATPRALSLMKEYYRQYCRPAEDPHTRV